MMIDRVFVVGHSTKKDRIIEYFVTDCHTDEELHNGERPHIAVFPVSQLYDSASQLHKAQVYSDYMNRINEATKKAYEQTMILDIMKQ